MRTIGVRDLKRGLSEVLRRVDAGESVQVTKRGRPVAEIVPVAKDREDQQLRELAMQGRITPASRPLPLRARPLKTGRSASAIVLAERESGR